MLDVAFLVCEVQLVDEAGEERAVVLVRLEAEGGPEVIVLLIGHVLGVKVPRVARHVGNVKEAVVGGVDEVALVFFQCLEASLVSVARSVASLDLLVEPLEGLDALVSVEAGRPRRVVGAAVDELDKRGSLHDGLQPLFVFVLSVLRDCQPDARGGTRVDVLLLLCHSVLRIVGVTLQA